MLCLGLVLAVGGELHALQGSVDGLAILEFGRGLRK
jgi:hypothetical protein